MAVPTITGFADDTGVSGDDGLTADATPALTGTAEPNATVVVRWGPRGGAPADGGTVFADDGGRWVFDFGLDADAAAYPGGLPDGDYDFEAEDVFGGGGPSAPVRIQVDTVAPVLTLDPVAGEINDTTPAIGGGTVANGTVEVRVDGALVGTATADGDGAWTYTPAALAEGPHTVAARAVDAAGNAATATDTFAVDLTAPAAPTIGLDPAAPAPGRAGRDTDDTTPTVSGTSPEIGGVVRVRVDGGAWIAAGTVGPGGGWSHTLAGPLAGGIRLVEAQVTDAAGNTSAPGGVALDVNTPATSGFAVSGTAAEGETLTATLLSLSDPEGHDPGAVAYGWQRSADGGATWADIAGAAGLSYALGQADAGAVVRVAARFTDLEGAEELVGSAATAVVANRNDAPVGTVLALGAAVRGATLLAADDFSDPDGVGASPVAHRWQRSADGGATWSDVAGAVGRAHEVAAADVGARLRAVATYEDAFGATEQVFGAATAVAAPRVVAVPGAPGGGGPVGPMTAAELRALLDDGGALPAASPGLDRIALADGVVVLGAGTAEAYVARLYLGLLGRAPDPGGLTAFSEAAADGHLDLAGLARAFLGSAEFAATGAGASDAALVDLLYGRLLGRAADAEGARYWADRIAGGDVGARAEAVVAFAGSAESAAHLAPATTGLFVRDAEATVVRTAYLAAFGREGDAGGVAFWSDALESGRVTAASLGDLLAGSVEFAARHGSRDDAAYVAAIYRDGFGRPVDPGGLAYFAGLLGSGAADRGDVLMALASSEEAVGRLDWAL